MNVDELQRQLAERRAGEVAGELLADGWPPPIAEAVRLCLLGRENEVSTEDLKAIEALILGGQA